MISPAFCRNVYEYTFFSTEGIWIHFCSGKSVNEARVLHCLTWMFPSLQITKSEETLRHTYRPRCMFSFFRQRTGTGHIGFSNSSSLQLLTYASVDQVITRCLTEKTEAMSWHFSLLHWTGLNLQQLFSFNIHPV